MVYELKRAIFNYRCLILGIVMICILALSSYEEVWKNAIFISNDDGSPVSNDMYLYYTQTFGNAYYIWRKSYVTIEAILPILVVFPFLLSYLEEKKNGYRYLCIARIGTSKYLINKVIAIAVGTAIVIGTVETIYFLILLGLGNTGNIPESYGLGVQFFYDLYSRNVLLHTTFILFLRVIFVFAFTVFSIGVTQRLTSKIGLIVIPFLVATTIDIFISVILHSNLLINYAYSLIFVANFSIFNYITIVSLLLAGGILMIVLGERKEKVIG